jgi:hypothetical protein
MNRLIEFVVVNLENLMVDEKICGSIQDYIMSIWKFYNWIMMLLKVLRQLYKGENIIIFNVQINEKCEFIFNHFIKKTQNLFNARVK